MSLSRDEVERRIAGTMAVCSQFAYTGQRRQALKAEVGIGVRQANTYIRVALKRMQESYAASVDEERAQSLAFYKSMIFDLAIEPRDRIRDQVALDKLLGLLAPIRKELSGPDGVPVAAGFAPACL